MMRNPWMPQGVSIFDPETMLPVIGQKDVFQKLLKYKKDILDNSHQLAGFFLLVGGWGLGKSRVGHEICRHAIDPDADWIVEGRGQRLLEPSLKEGILPLFICYNQVTDDKALKDHLSIESWIPVCACKALRYLVHPPSTTAGHTSRRNQARIFDRLIEVLNAKGLEALKPALAAALDSQDPAQAAREALKVLEKLGIKQLLVIIDELEDITDVQREGLPDDDRVGIEKELLTLVARVIKREDTRLDFPQINFVLLTAKSVSNFLGGIKALERRTEFVELQSNAFHDVEDYWKYVEANRPEIWDSMKKYPEGLKEAAFFAANRNFGWFNVVMHFCHQNHKGNALPVPKLLQQFAEHDPRGSRSVFDVRATTPTMIPADADRTRILEIIYGQLPQRIGGDGISEIESHRLFQKTFAGTGQPLLAPVVEVDAPPAQLPKWLRDEGFRWAESGSEFILPGQARVDLDLVLSSLASYSIKLGKPDQQHFLIFEDLAEFTEQLRGLTPYDQEASVFAPPLHRFFMQAAFRVRESNQERRYLAPSFSFLLRFNLLNKRGQVESGFLRDPKKDSLLHQRFNDVKLKPAQYIDALLLGLAQAWEGDSQVETHDLDELETPAFGFFSKQHPLSIGARGRVTMLHVGSSEDDQKRLQEDLRKLAPRPERPAHPVILVVESAPDREQLLSAMALKTAPALAPFIIVRNFSSTQVEILVRLGLLGNTSGLSLADPRTNQFIGGISVSREHLSRALKDSPGCWLERLDENGLILNPIFFRKVTTASEWAVLARGYSLMLQGRKKFNELLREGDDTFTEDERDVFRKRVPEQVVPPARYAGLDPLPIFREDDGEYRADVPRQLVRVLTVFGSVARTPQQLESLFLYSTSEPGPQEILRQLCAFLENAGLLDLEAGGKYRRVSATSVRDGLQRCEDWLHGTGEKDLPACLNRVRSVNEKDADDLALWTKKAGDALKSARQLVERISLGFLDETSDQLGTQHPDPVTQTDQPRFYVAFRQAVGALHDARLTTGRIFEPGEFGELLRNYSRELLADYEANHGRAGFPMWKRAGILTGFYAEFNKLKTQLLDRIKAHQRAGHEDVPLGPDGKPVFPTQVLIQPLKIWQQELEFPNDNPQRTIRLGETTLGINSLGFQIAAGNYGKAWQRLCEIEAELTQPGKLVARYFDCLDKWRALQQEYTDLQHRAEQWNAFFGSADASTRTRFKVDQLVKGIANLGQIFEGAIRHGVDEVEPMVSCFKLIETLEQDLSHVLGTPKTYVIVIEHLSESVITTLTEEFKAAHQDVIGAWARIRAARNELLESWPSKLAADYLETRQTFAGLVARAEAEGRAFFSDVTEPKWEDYLGLCRMDVQGKDISWDQPPYSNYVSALQRKRLVRLKLI